MTANDPIIAGLPMVPHEGGEYRYEPRTEMPPLPIMELYPAGSMVGLTLEQKIESLHVRVTRLEGIVRELIAGRDGDGSPE